MQTLRILCTDCEIQTRRFEERGFRVLDCEPIAGDPGFCQFRFTLPGERAVPAAAALAAPGSPLTPSQTQAAQAIVNIFETDAVRGRYGQVTLIAGDSGRLTYGRSQTTLGSGNLALLLQRYCTNPGARFGRALEPWLPALAQQAASVDTDLLLHNLLRAAADDPLMREMQDQFFDETYWQPALKAANRHGIASPLGVAVVYDSHVHGSWLPLKKQVDAAGGTPAQQGEAAWIAAYVETRRDWLATHPTRPDLRKTVYRMQAFARLIELGQWGLTLPFVLRDHEVSALTLAAAPPDCYEGPAPGSRPLSVQQPLLRGLDVRLAQLALSRQGLQLKADGVYGRTSMELVRAWQLAQGRPDSGLLSAAEILALTG